MGARGANRLAELAVELREQVPPQFLPKQDATLRPDFALAEFAVSEALNADRLDFSPEIKRDTAQAPTPEPALSDVDDGTALELEPDEVAPEMNVVDTPGASDIHEQQQDVSAVHEEAGEMQRRLDALAQKAVSDGKDFESSINGFRASGMWVNAQQTESSEKKRKEADEKFTQAMLKKMLDDRLQWLDDQIKYWKEQERVWEERGDAIAEAIARKQRGENIEVDQDGLPRDQKLREAADAYEKKYGRRLDVNNQDDLLVLQRFAQDETSRARQQREQYEREREQRLEQRNELESNHMTPEGQQEVGQQLRSLEGQKGLGIIAANGSRALNQTIDGIAATTADDRALVEARLAGQSGYAQTSATAEDEMFGGGTSVAKNADPLGFPQDSLRPGFSVAASGESAPAPEDPAQRVAAVPASGPVRSA